MPRRRGATVGTWRRSSSAGRRAGPGETDADRAAGPARLNTTAPSVSLQCRDRAAPADWSGAGHRSLWNATLVGVFGPRQGARKVARSAHVRGASF